MPCGPGLKLGRRTFNAASGGRMAGRGIGGRFLINYLSTGTVKIVLGVSWRDLASHPTRTRFRLMSEVVVPFFSSSFIF